MKGNNRKKTVELGKRGKKTNSVCLQTVNVIVRDEAIFSVGSKLKGGCSDDVMSRLTPSHSARFKEM